MCPRPAALLQAHGGGLGGARLVCHCLLVELRDGWALVDTGLGTQDVAQPNQRLGRGFVLLTNPVLSAEEPAVVQLARFGLSARDVRHVLPTHLDLDHAGGIADFPHATIHVLEREHRAATERATLRERERYKRVQFKDARFQLHEPGGESWFGFEGVRPLAGSDDEILFIPLYGHTRGHAGVAVRTSDGWLLHAGDAYFAHGEVHGTRAPIGLEAFGYMMQVDGAARLKNRARLRELAKTRGSEVKIICAHDPDELASFTR